MPFISLYLNVHGLRTVPRKVLDFLSVNEWDIHTSADCAVVIILSSEHFHNAGFDSGANYRMYELAYLQVGRVR